MGFDKGNLLIATPMPRGTRGSKRSNFDTPRKIGTHPLFHLRQYHAFREDGKGTFEVQISRKPFELFSFSLHVDVIIGSWTLLVPRRSLILPSTRLMIRRRKVPGAVQMCTCVK